ncbi:hypothetical protein ABVT39_020256 [Epinephelus coioides]
MDNTDDTDSKDTADGTPSTASSNVTAAEVAHIYHTEKHALSYNSADCALKLTLRTLNDSSIAKKMSCGKTKAEAVVTDVLSPKAIEENWVPLKSYLISIGEECPRRLKALLRLIEDGAGVEEEAGIVEMYLLFCNNVMSLFEDVCVDLYSIIDSFLRRLIQRRDDGFYGYPTRQKLQRLSPSDADVARQEFATFLNTAISYVQKWFDFSEQNWLFHLQPFSLASGKISFDDMEKITEQLHLVGSTGSAIYEQTQIDNAFREFYFKLYQSEGSKNEKDMEAFFKDIPLPTLKEEEREHLEVPVYVKIPLCPSVCLLGTRIESIQSKLTHHIIALAFMSVKRIILMNWKSHKPNCFNIDNWLKDFLNLLSMERAASTLFEYDHGGDEPWIFIRSYLGEMVENGN